MNENYFALSMSQKNILSQELKFSNSPINNICISLGIEGRLDFDLLEQTLNIILKSDDSLRTRFAKIDDETVQYVQSYSYHKFPIFDFSLTNHEGIEYWAYTVSRVIMPLYNSDMFEFYLYKCGERQGGLLVKTHHLISDGFSQVLLCNRIAEIYLKSLNGEEILVDPFPLYQKHIENETAYLNSDQFQKDEQYWKDRVERMPDPVSMKDISSAAITNVGKRLSFELSEKQNHLIYQYCYKKRVSPFSLFYMALTIWLKRARQVERSTIGVPIVNRSSFTDKNTSGMFVSTLPFLCEIDDRWSLDEFNERLNEAWFDLLRHQKYPFERIFALAKQHKPATGHLFHLMLSYQNSLAYQNDNAQVYFDGRWNYSGYQSEHLCIHVSNRLDLKRYRIDYDYLIQIFNEKEIEQIHQSLMILLQDALQNPNKPLWALNFLSEEEENRVLYRYSAPLETHINIEPLSTLLTKNAKNHATRVALIHNGKRTTYRMLVDNAQTLAATIFDRIGANEVVALLLPRDESLVLSMVATMFSGNAWLTIDSQQPRNRIREILKESRARLLICNDATTATDYPIDSLVYECPKPLSKEAIQQDHDVNRLAYLVYTSGTTGAPKGVRVLEKSLVNFAMGCRTLYAHGAVLSLCNVGFDAFVLETIVSLINGQTIVLAEQQKINNPEHLAMLIRNYAVGFLAMTPSRLSTYLKNESFQKAMSRIETIICGGEILTSDLLQKVRMLSSARLINQYGPSEATIGVTYKDLSQANTLSVGQPMPGCRVYVLDDRLLPLPVCSIGEIYLSGLCIADGYHHNLEETDRLFIDNPYEPNEKMYRTNDVGYWNADGDLVIIGRKDDQVKLHGYRIELNEISAKLMLLPDIEQAVTIHTTIEDKEILAAYYVSNREIGPLKLKEHLASYFPYYMVPAIFIPVDSIPLTTNGKVDVTLLPKPRIETINASPETTLQSELLQLLKHHLGKDDFFVTSDYFLAGGDSLTAIEFLAMIEQNYQVQISIQEFYALRTIIALEESIRIKQGLSPLENDTIKKALIQSSYPLTPIQKNIYVLSHESNTAYNMPGILTFNGHLDQARLQRAIETLLNENPVLRSRFVIENNELIAKVEQPLPFKLAISEADVLQTAVQEFVRPFDLAQAPLFRAMLWRDEKQDHVLLDMHHIIMDGISTPQLLKSLKEAYESSGTRRSELTYIDYAWWMNQRDPAYLKSQADYWKKRLASLPEPFRVFSNPYKDPIEANAGQLNVRFDRTLSDWIRKCALHYEITPFMLMISAFGLLLHRFSRQDALCIGTVVSGRNHPHTQNIIGPFINTLPLLLTFDPQMRLEDYLKISCLDILTMLNNQDIDQEEILRQCGLSRSRSASLLYNVLFSMRPFENEPIRFEQLTASLRPVDNQSLKMDLSLEVFEDRDGFGCRFDYDRSLFNDAQIAFYAECYQVLLEEFYKRGEGTCEELNLIPLKTQIDLFEDPFSQRTPYHAQFIDKLIDRQAFLQPNKAAIVFRDETMTFSQLLLKTDKLAKLLVYKGIKSNDRIAIALPRGIGLIVSMLAILKAGAVYVPLDLDFPKERLTYMLENSECKMVITDETILGAHGELTNYPIIDWTEDIDCSHVTFTKRSIDDAMYILYTSGSTGLPKGVLLPHSALSNLFSSMAFVYTDSNQPVLCSTNPIFDIFISESLFALASGRTMILCDEQQMLLPWEMAKLIDQYQIDLIQFTPSRCAYCLNEDNFFKSIKQVKDIILVGEAVTMSLMRKLQDSGDIRILNFYGPTEAAVYVSYADLTNVEEVTIGKPLANCRMYVMDEKRRLLPPTVAGELYLAGECLALGYVNNAELTNDVFVQDPLFETEKMYKSGDLGYLDLNGDFVYISRIDSQIKFNGHRIETSEINELLLKHNLVQEAITLPIEEDGVVIHLHTFAVSNQSTQALKDFLKNHLPSYMVPSFITLLDKIPLTFNGKADIKALKEYELEVHESSKSSNTETNDLEEAMIAIWKDAIKIDRIEMDKSFFEQGGSSLGALIVLSAYFNNGWSMTMKDFYDHVTIREQIAFIKHHVSTDDIKKAITYRTAPPRSFINKQSGQICLLTGAGGYLGSHLLYHLVEDPSRTVYCLIRDKQRFKNHLTYYFGSDWLMAHDHQIIAILSDINEDLLKMNPSLYEYLTHHVEEIYHTAADVRHYGKESEIMGANLQGTIRILEFAKQSNAYLHHISTIGIMGDKHDANKTVGSFSEMDFDIGQNWMDNLYIKSKFLAEEEVYKAIDQGLGAHVYRVGHLVGRQSDGLFQINPESNEVYRILSGLREIGSIPISLSRFSLELTPIDACASAILALSRSPQTTYHVYNPHPIRLAECLPQLEIISDDRFEQILKDVAIDRQNTYIPDVVAAYNRLLSHESTVTLTSDLTVAELQKCGYCWSDVNVRRLFNNEPQS